ncbi:Acetoacetyl-CoA synthase [gamma proteobacterium IMCC2047]|nr:Acetoacetyl-CoA synthase [gamma proteobacterium IMCC2047]
MQTLYDQDAPKKAANLSINSDLLSKSKALNINLSATLEQVLRDKLAEKEAENWQKENKRAIQAYNDMVEEHGLFSDEHRSF